MTTTRETAMTARDEAGAIAGTARDEAANVATTAAGAALDVAQTAKQTTGEVVGEAARQARDLVGETRDQMRQQAETQTKRLAENARSLAGEISGMAARSEQQGPATEIAQQLAGRVESLAGYLDGTTPEAVVDDLRDLARRRPGMFLLGAGALGFLAGRMIKGATSDGTSASGSGGESFTATGDLSGTAAGQPTAGLEIPAGTGVGTGVALPVEPYPTGAAGATTATGDASIGSADFRGTGSFDG